MCIYIRVNYPEKAVLINSWMRKLCKQISKNLVTSVFNSLFKYLLIMISISTHSYSFYYLYFHFYKSLESKMPDSGSHCQQLLFFQICLLGEYIYIFGFFFFVNFNFHVNLIGSELLPKPVLVWICNWLRLRISHGKRSSTQKVTENLMRELVLGTLTWRSLQASVEVGPMAVIRSIVLHFNQQNKTNKKKEERRNRRKWVKRWSGCWLSIKVGSEPGECQ